MVARDYGFAPNPFHGVCTLATCKPGIRARAEIDDWVVGTGSKTKGRDGYLVFAMRVSEVFDFDAYWKDPRFELKKPTLNSSLKLAFGDNIYHHDEGGAWNQVNSHHSYRDGSANVHNVNHDTQANRVLVSDDFVYFGGSGPKIPKRFRKHGGVDVCAIRGYKNQFTDAFATRFVLWVRSLSESGYVGQPIDW